MAWVERTFVDVDPPSAEPGENVHLSKMLRNMPPYMKIKSRRARKALEKYEIMKQQYIEKLRQNHVYKFVMQVAAFTNEDIQKYWKGKSLTPFIEEFTPEPIKMSDADLTRLHERARVNAMADLHQYCRRIRAVPMFREDPASETSGDPAIRALNFDVISPPTGGTTSIPIVGTPGGNRRARESNSGGESKINVNRSNRTYIYNMRDIEYETFIKSFLAQRAEYERQDQEYFVLPNDSAEHDVSDDRHKVYDEYETNNDMIASLGPPDNGMWISNVPIVRWEDPYAEFWFQRYIARWLRETEPDGDLREFQSKYRSMFNNLAWENGWFMRDLTGMRLTYTQEGVVRVYDFVKPLFDQREEWWRHELVLGEFEKRSMYQADQWLQKTPWAIGKIYLEPSLYGHMVEAHTLITTKFQKFRDVSLEALVRDEKHAYFMSKLVAMCVRTSAILSGKRYGLDKAYMRVNLEKRRLLHAWSKLQPPRRSLRRRYVSGRVRSPSGRSGA